MKDKKVIKQADIGVPYHAASTNGHTARARLPWRTCDGEAMMMDDDTRARGSQRGENIGDTNCRCFKDKNKKNTFKERLH